jgi:hypothetical protein
MLMVGFFSLIFCSNNLANHQSFIFNKFLSGSLENEEKKEAARSEDAKFLFFF